MKIASLISDNVVKNTLDVIMDENHHEVNENSNPINYRLMPRTGTYSSIVPRKVN